MVPSSPPVDVESQVSFVSRTPGANLCFDERLLSKGANYLAGKHRHESFTLSSPTIRTRCNRYLALTYMAAEHARIAGDVSGWVPEARSNGIVQFSSCCRDAPMTVCLSARGPCIPFRGWSVAALHSGKIALRISC